MSTQDAPHDAAVSAAREDRTGGVALGWCAQVLAFAALTLALCNAEAARGWADGLEPSPSTEMIRNVCDGWADFTDTLGLSTPRKLVRGTWDHRHAVLWPGTRPQPDQR